MNYILPLPVFELHDKTGSTRWYTFLQTLFRKYWML